VFRINDIGRALGFDVASLHGDVKDRFAGRLAVFRSREAAGPQPVFPVIAQPGAGKTHLLYDFCRQTVEGGGFFVPVDLTDISDFWRLSCDSAVRTLLSEGMDGHVAAVRLVRRMLEAAEFTRLPDTQAQLARWLGALGAKLPIVLKNLVNKLSANAPGLQPGWSDAARCLVGICSDDPEVAISADRWLSAVSEGQAAPAALGLSEEATGSPPDLKKRFFALNSLMALKGGFTVLAYDQLDKALDDYQADPCSGEVPTEGWEGRVADSLALNLARARAGTRRTLVAVTSLPGVWERLADGAKTAGIPPYVFADPEHLSPVTDAAVLKALMAARLRPAFDKAPGFKPPYPCYPFPRAFFEAVNGKYPRDIFHLARNHVRHCSERGEVFEWEEEIPRPSPPLEEPPAPSPDPYGKISLLFKDALAAATGKLPPDKGDEFAWLDALEAFIRSFAAEKEGSLPAGVVIKLMKREPPRTSVIPISASLELRTGRIVSKTLHVCIIPSEHSTAFLNRLNQAVSKSKISKGNAGARLALVRATRPPSGAKTKKIYGHFLAEGGTAVTLDGIAGALMLALKEVYDWHQDKFCKWAAVTKPVTGSGFMKAELDWLAEA
jgi:hypothetical protein